MAVNVGDILATFRVIDEATQPLEQIAGAQEEASAALSRLTEQYTSATGSIESWNALAQEFTGIDLAAKANDMASAVEAIGGASRLTQKEQAQVNAVMEEALAKYQALGMEAPPNIQALADATRDASAATKGLGKDAEGAEGGMSMLTKGIGLAAAAATAAVAALGAMGAAVLKIGEHGAGVGDITEQFGKLATKAGVDTVDALNALRNATAGTISDFDLMKASLPLLSSGFKGTAEDLGTMAEAARVLSERGMGLDQAMQMVTSAMTTGRTRALSMQGVVIDTAQSMKDLTDATNEEGGAVQESAKLHLKQQEILKGLKGLVQENGEVLIDFADRTDQVRVAFKNFYDEFARRLSESEGLTTVFDRISTAIVNAFGGEQEAAMKGLLDLFDRIMVVVGDVAVTLIEVGAKAFKWFKAAAEEASSSGAWAAFVSIFSAIGKALSLVWDLVVVVGKVLMWLADKLMVFDAIGKGFGYMATAIEAVGKVVSWAVDKFRLIITAIDTLRGKADELPAVTGGFDDLHKRGFQPVISASDALQGKLGPLTQGIGAVGGAAKLTGEQLKTMADAEAAMSGAKQIAETQTLIATYDRLAKQGITPTIAAQKALHKAVEDSIAIYVEAGQKVPPALLRIEAATKNAANGLDRWSSETAIARDEVWKFGQVLEDEVAPALAATANLMNVVLLPAVVKTGGVFDEMGNRIGELAENAEDGMKKAGEEMGESWGDGFTRIAKNFGTLMSDAIINGDWRNAFAALGSQVGEFLGAKLGASLGKAVGGMFGKVLGAVLPGIGSMLGPLVDKAFGWLTKAEGRKVNDLRDQFISAAGGLDALNKKAHDAGLSLDALLRANNTKAYEAAVKDLEKAFAAVEARIKATSTAIGDLAKSGGLMTRQLAEAIVKDKGAAEIKAALADLFTVSIDRAITGFNTIGKNVLSMTGLWGEQMQALKAELEKDAKSIRLSTDFTDSLPKTFARVGVLASAAFSAALAKGMTVGEALKAIEPGLASLADLLRKTGTQATGSLEAMLRWREVISTHQDLFDSLDGINDMLIGLQNSGLLTAETFAELSAMAVEGFTNLTNQGVAADEAMRLMQPTLQTLWQLQEDFGYAVDETTAKMLAEAEASGIVGDAFRSAQDRMAAGIEKLVDLMSALVQSMGVALPDAAEQGARATEEAFQRMDLSVKEPWADWGTPPEYGGGELPSFAGGTHGRYPDFGAGTMVMLHGRERVMTESEAGSGGGSGTLIMPIQMDGRTVTEVIIKRLGNRLKVNGVNW